MMHSDKGCAILLLVMAMSFVEGNPNGLIEKEGIEGRNITFQVSIPLQEKEYNLTLMIGSKAAWTDVDWTPVFEYHLIDHSLNILDGKFIGRFDVQEYPSSGYLKVTLIHLKQSDDGQYRMRLFGPGLDRTVDEVFKIHVREDRCSYCPCFNGGSCSYDTIGDRVCSCPINYSGGSCEISEKGLSSTETYSLTGVVLMAFFLVAGCCILVIYLCKNRQKVKNWFSRVPRYFRQRLGRRALHGTGNILAGSGVQRTSEEQRLIDENEKNTQLLNEKNQMIEVLEREKHDLDENWRREQSRCVNIQTNLEQANCDNSELKNELEALSATNGQLKSEKDDLQYNLETEQKKRKSIQLNYFNLEKTHKATVAQLNTKAVENKKLTEKMGKKDVKKDDQNDEGRSETIDTFNDVHTSMLALINDDTRVTAHQAES